MATCRDSLFDQFAAVDCGGILRLITLGLRLDVPTEQCNVLDFGLASLFTGFSALSRTRVVTRIPPLGTRLLTDDCTMEMHRVTLECAGMPTAKSNPTFLITSTFWS